tara:strand:- start:362 stop:793 length:432 start_codon:yes stop_codon:yes gene_type:complete
MATLTIVKDDKFVSIDGEGLHLDEVVLPSNVHTIQWDGTNGWIEYNDGTDNKSISSISDYSTITDNHATKKAAEAASATEAANAQTALEATYGWKRENDSTTSYSSVGDQLDQLYKDMLAGKLDATGEWAKGIKAVKDAHPKS